MAPTALFTENVIRPFAPRMGDKQFLLLLRVVLVTFSLAALLFALIHAARCTRWCRMPIR